MHHRDSTRQQPDNDYVALIRWNKNAVGFNVTIEDPEELLGRWLGSNVDRTVGKKARLIIQELSPEGSCSFDTCSSCNADDNCEWNERSSSCRPFDASLGFSKAVSCRLCLQQVQGMGHPRVGRSCLDL